ncbi:MAG: hypothetical protein J6D53_01125 [Blautia sp.]|nr:hypothetical protein [Blautia sp.]
MKTTIKRILSCVIVMAMLITVLSGATEIAERKASDFKYAPFFEHAKDIDVLFLGSSHMLNAVYPMDLWNRYGITSYNFGGHSCQLAGSYWTLMNALDYSSPKAVVVDCMFLASQGKAADNFSYQHLSFDAFPLSITKIRTVLDLVNDKTGDQTTEESAEESANSGYEKRTAIGLLWNYSVYHTRWTELSEEDFVGESTHEYGAEARVRIVEPVSIIDNDGKKFREDTMGMKYLRKIIEECQKRNIDVVLTYLPYPITNMLNWREVNTLNDIAEEYGVDYVNFHEEDVVDFNVDCYDANSHINVSGALKITDYFGDFLADKYDLPDHREDPEYAYWDEDFVVYKQDKDSRLGTVKDLNTFLMLLPDRDYGFVLDIEDPRIFEDETTLDLLRNMGINVDEIDDETKYIIAYGNDTRVLNAEAAESVNLGDIIPSAQHGEDGIIINPDEGEPAPEDDTLYRDGKIIANVYNSDGTGLVNVSAFAIPVTSTGLDRTPQNGGQIVLVSRAERVN